MRTSIGLVPFSSVASYADTRTDENTKSFPCEHSKQDESLAHSQPQIGQPDRIAIDQ